MQVALLLLYSYSSFFQQKYESCFRLTTIEKLNNYDFSDFRAAMKVPLGSNPNRQGVRRMTRPGGLEPLVSFCY